MCLTLLYLYYFHWRSDVFFQSCCLFLQSYCLFLVGFALGFENGLPGFQRASQIDIFLLDFFDRFFLLDFFININHFNSTGVSVLTLPLYVFLVFFQGPGKRHYTNCCFYPRTGQWQGHINIVLGHLPTSFILYVFWTSVVLMLCCGQHNLWQTPHYQLLFRWMPALLDFFDNAWVSNYIVNWLQVPKLQKVFMFTFSFKELKSNASKPVKLPCLPVVSSPANRDSIYDILILANNIYLIFLSGSSIYIMLGVFRKSDFSSKLARSIWTVSQCKLPI